MFQKGRKHHAASPSRTEVPPRGLTGRDNTGQQAGRPCWFFYGDEPMAWRPNEQLIEGELSNEVRGIVTGFLIFRGLVEPVVLTLEGDFHRDIRGTTIKLCGSPDSADEEQSRNYMDGFSAHQTGRAGDITAGKEPIDYVNYPYIEWYSNENGRVVLELMPEQVTVIGRPLVWSSEKPIDPHQSREQCKAFLAGVARAITEESK